VAYGKNISILYHFRDIIVYFPKFKKSRDRNHDHVRDTLSSQG